MYDRCHLHLLGGGRQLYPEASTNRDPWCYFQMEPNSHPDCDMTYHPWEWFTTHVLNKVPHNMRSNRTDTMARAWVTLWALSVQVQRVAVHFAPQNQPSHVKIFSSPPLASIPEYIEVSVRLVTDCTLSIQPERTEVKTLVYQVEGARGDEAITHHHNPSRKCSGKTKKFLL